MMMKHPLLIKTMLERSRKLFPKKEIFSRCFEKDHRLTYGDMHKRVCRLANVLQSLGAQRGDKIGTFAWNNHRHLELYFAVTCSDMVLHTLNLRLFPEHLIHVINHAADKIIFVDEDLIPLLERVSDQLTTVEKYVILTDKEELPPTRLSPALHYEKLLADAPETFEFPDDVDENSPAGMCYTTATTGLPKGVLYTQRSIYLHSLVQALPDIHCLAEQDVLMPVVPMFHVMAWGLPFSAAWLGTKLVMPGRVLTPDALCKLMEQEKVTISAGVPTIWMSILQHLEAGNKYDLSALRHVAIGGSAASANMIKLLGKFGINVFHAYGMTETSPVVLASRLKSYMKEWGEDRQYALRAKQGLLLPGLDMKIVNNEGNEVAWDGKEMGELCVRGPWIAGAYFDEPERSKENFRDGWLYTNDMVTIDEEGFVLIQDRAKDLIKSGGEWISSVDLENVIMIHPAVAEAAVIAIPDPKWQERPMACVVLKAAEKDKVTEADILAFLEGKVAKWWLPDKVMFIDEIPKTSVGKFNKKALRERFG
ncbi:MAG: Long-chain-fatty-acid--CoA ligase [Syntrophomonadaceae bacterium]|nr:Long-chain-fatty-acid--CoA ligase [Bacillota bacterium]